MSLTAMKCQAFIKCKLFNKHEALIKHEAFIVIVIITTRYAINLWDYELATVFPHATSMHYMQVNQTASKKVIDAGYTSMLIFTRCKANIVDNLPVVEGIVLRAQWRL